MNHNEETVTQSEGELNTSARRAEWLARNHNAHSQDLLAEDAKYFLHQSVSTPCMSVIAKAEGAYIEDVQGKRYLDFHGILRVFESPNILLTFCVGWILYWS